MAMSITKLMAGTASKYYENTVDSVLSDHGGGMANYYNAPGTPPGVWLGSGLGRYGLKAGTQASNKQVHRLYDGLRQPNTGKKLVRMNDESIKAGKVVGGYDLTFHMPKSVNILWASGDKDVRAAIMKAHKEAMGESVAWFETHVASSRSGAGGVVRQRAKGVVAVAYTHWDSRDHDPHLHDHVLISNLVERADGKAGALDGGSAFRAAVAISERHTNLLMDKLTQSLGVQWHRRTGLDSKASVYEIDGVSDELIEAFSSRHNGITDKKKQLIELARSKGDTVEKSRLEALDRQAWRETRKAKPKQPLSLSQLMDSWQSAMREHGIDPAQFAGSCVGASFSAIDARAALRDRDAMRQLSALLDQSIREQGGQLQRSVTGALHENVKANRTRITLDNVRAEAARLVRGVRVIDGQADELIDALSSVETARLVPLTAQRYEISESMKADERITGWNGRAVTDDQEGFVFATRELLDAEQAFIQRADATYEPARQLDRQAVADAVEAASAAAAHPLAEDQSAAATRLLLDGRMIVALNGAAGTGKTTTLRAVVRSADRLQGEGLVLGLAPTAAGAGELKKSLGIQTETVAKILYEARTGSLQARLARANERLGAARTPAARRAAREQVAALSAQSAALRIPRNGIVIVDEAGMADTMSVALLSRLCAENGAKIIMVGDSMQLSSPGEGSGAFSWLVDHGRAQELTTVFRFRDPGEAVRAEHLRRGIKDKKKETYTALDEYEQAGAIHAVREADAERAVVDRMVEDLSHGVDSILVTATNQDMADLNRLISGRLQGLGLVDSTRRVTLSDGSEAGRGDAVCTRANNRGLRTPDGTIVRNSDIWTVERVNDDGSLDVHRRGDRSATLTLPAAYVQASAEGGYAMTAQRSQGRTVERSYTYLGAEADSFSRSMLYVGMTRGRQGNECYVAVRDPEDMRTEGMDSYEIAFWQQRKRPGLEQDGRREWKGQGPAPDRERWYTADDLLPEDIEQARLRLGQVMDVGGGSELATSWRQRYEKSMRQPKRLAVEWDYYTRLLAERRLEEQVVGPERMRQLAGDPQSLAGMVAAYGEASLIDRRQADRIVRTSIQGGANSVRRALNEQINDRDAGRNTWVAGRYAHAQAGPDESQRVRDAAGMANQSLAMLADGLAERAARDGEKGLAPAWTKAIGPAPEPGGAGRRQWERLIEQIEAYRAENDVDDLEHPLGKPGAGAQDAWRDHAWRERLEQRIEAYRATPPDPDVMPGLAPQDSRGFDGGTVRRLLSGRPLLIDMTAGQPHDGIGRDGEYATVRSTNPAGAIERARAISPAAVERIAIRADGADAHALLRAWDALSRSQRYTAVLVDAPGGPRPLYESVARRAGAERTLGAMDPADARSAERALRRRAPELMAGYMAPESGSTNPPSASRPGSAGPSSMSSPGEGMEMGGM